MGGEIGRSDSGIVWGRQLTDPSLEGWELFFVRHCWRCWTSSAHSRARDSTAERRSRESSSVLMKAWQGMKGGRADLIQRLMVRRLDRRELWWASSLKMFDLKRAIQSFKTSLSWSGSSKTVDEGRDRAGLHEPSDLLRTRSNIFKIYYCRKEGELA